MFEIDGKQYRNLEEQVGYLTEAFHTGKLIDELGIKVLGVYATLDEAKQATPGPYDYGEAFQIGPYIPYNLYIFTRNVGADGEADFFNFGPFPAPGEQGPQGIQGERGADGKDGERGPRGAQGLQGYKGDKGDVGATGPIGPQGPKGDKGDVGPSMLIAGTLTSTSLLPTPTKALQEKGTVYIIPASDGVNHMWAIQGETSFKWVDIGISGIQGQQGPAGQDGAGVNTTSDVKLDIGDTTVSYDTTDGIVINSVLRVTFNNGETHDCPVRYSIPIKGVNGMAFDKADGEETIEAGLSRTDFFTIAGANFEQSSYFPGKKIQITPLGLTQQNGDHLTLYYLPEVEGNADNLVVESRLPTLFGNKSLQAGGNIDIYQHNITILMRDTAANTLGMVYLLVYSSNNLVVDSLTDLKTLLGSTFAIQATGYYKNAATNPTIWGSIFRATQTGISYISSQSNAEQTVAYSNPTFTDRITTI